MMEEFFDRMEGLLRVALEPRRQEDFDRPRRTGGRQRRSARAWRSQRRCGSDVRAAFMAREQIATW